MVLDLNHGLRQPIEDLIAHGYSAPWVVFCNTFGFYKSGEYESEYGHITINAHVFHMPFDDLTIMSVATYEAIKAEAEVKGEG